MPLEFTKGFLLTTQDKKRQERDPWETKRETRKKHKSLGRNFMHGGDQNKVRFAESATIDLVPEVHSEKKKYFQTPFWCFSPSQVGDSCQYLEGPISTWKDHYRNIGVHLASAYSK